MLLISDSVTDVKRLPIIVALAITGVGACANDAPTDDGTVTVAVAFYPIEEIVRRVGGSNIEVATLVPPGDEPHEFEPPARQVADLENADVVFFLGNGFQPNLQKAIEALPDSVRRVDLLQAGMLYGLSLILVGDDGVDPHVWLDPQQVQSMADTVAGVLSEISPGLTNTYFDSSSEFGRELDALDDEFKSGLSDCDVPVLITTHEAFAYLASAYGLTHLAIAGISPGNEPSAQALEEIAEAAKQNGVTTVFFEENLPPDLARTVADEIGAATSSLATAETLTQSQLDAGESYLSIMRDNLQALRAGLGCA